MAGYKEIAVLLAVAALLGAAAAGAAEDDHMYHWKCFKSCTGKCRHDEDAASKVDGAGAGDALNSSISVAVPGGGVNHKCKKGCMDECFEDLPGLCYQQCVVSTCVCLPPFSKEKLMCMKSCCEKCFHHGPMPGPPGPGPKPPKPSPSPPKQPPSPPKQPPSPPKPSPPKAPKPSPPAPKPKPKPPCPPGSEPDNGK
ncbi:chitin-binding lectin 1-like [Phragmites australis]|uniref:chitin-binding lectin 1-like n=1 Tax=Phragmites australis TaxID=29695 RepID=UPI002D764B35|nr:chitin-binding lectin 1-like [Phragmites australis]